jgi:secretion/DNA translocation related CpaE-like protein
MGARRVLTLPEDQSDLVDELRAAESPDRARGRLVGVIGGCGGAGASTLASGLALTASATWPTVLIDGDPLGGGLDVLLGAEAAAGLRWGDLAGTRGRLDPAAFAEALCQVGGIALLAWGMSMEPAGGATERRGTGELVAPAVVGAVIDAAVQAFGAVVVDLPRVAGPVDDPFLDALDAPVLVVPAEVRAVAATASLIGAIGGRLTAPHLVVRESGSGLAARDVAASLGLELVAVLRHEQSVQTAGQRGDLPLRRGRGALAQTCEAVLASLDAPAMAR